MTNDQILFTKTEVIKMVDELLQRPDILLDAIENENTNHTAESLINDAWRFAKLYGYEDRF
jgi:hypothetical protein